MHQSVRQIRQSARTAMDLYFCENGQKWGVIDLHITGAIPMGRIPIAPHAGS